MRTLLLKRMGSSITAGMNTTLKLIQKAEGLGDEEEEENTQALTKDMTSEELDLLLKVYSLLNQFTAFDPKYIRVKELLDSGTPSDPSPWSELGCILFSQYYDTVQYMAKRYSDEHPNQEIGVYAGGDKSGIYVNGEWIRYSKEFLKNRVREGRLKILFGTDSASEGLNLQRLGTLINIDLPWNPTRLEQRKGRIQRIGQLRDTVYVYNMRYKDSVEDRVHSLLSERLKSIHALFGQIPDVLEDVWVNVALGEKEEAIKLIRSLPIEHPFEIKYNRIANIPWERYERVLNEEERKSKLKEGWG